MATDKWRDQKPRVQAKTIINSLLSGYRKVIVLAMQSILLSFVKVIYVRGSSLFTFER